MSAASAYLIACHSGENAAKGQNAARWASPGTYPSNATGGRIARIGRQRHQRVGLRRPLDQHDVRALLRQGGPHRPGRARAVVPDPVQGDAAAHPVTSRQAR